MNTEAENIVLGFRILENDVFVFVFNNKNLRLVRRIEMKLSMFLLYSIIDQRNSSFQRMTTDRLSQRIFGDEGIYSYE